MKKVLISIILISLLVLAYFVICNGIQIANWRSTSFKDMQALNSELDSKIETSVSLNDQQYPEAIDNLESSIKNLKKSKEMYENKTKYIEDNVEIGVVKIKQYKIEKLWIVLANYAKDEGIDLKIDVLEGKAEDTYDLDVTVIGEYIGITDFIYDIEKDDELGFEILNFKLLPYSTVSVETTTDENGETVENKTTASVYVNKLTGTFKIENVGIDFD